MFKCEKCGKSYPKKIYLAHIKRCNVAEEEPVINMDNPYKDMSKDELKALAKERGIKSWHLKSAETLEAELLKDDAE